MKSYTDLEQSKKLAEILPIESADTYYEKGIGDNYRIDFGNYADVNISKNLLHIDAIPCWSLAALLDVLPLPNLVQDKADDELFWQCSIYDEDGNLLCETYDNNPIDACYEMIIHLHELKML